MAYISGVIGVLSVSGLLLVSTAAESATACSVPFIRTLDNQTVDGTMTVQSGKRCSIRLRASRGPIYSAEIVVRPSHGGVRVAVGNLIVYQPRSGFVGSDTFTYARRGLDSRNNPVKRTVRIAVTVTP